MHIKHSGVCRILYQHFFHLARATYLMYILLYTSYKEVIFVFFIEGVLKIFPVGHLTIQSNVPFCGITSHKTIIVKWVHFLFCLKRELGRKVAIGTPQRAFFDPSNDCFMLLLGWVLRRLYIDIYFSPKLVLFRIIKIIKWIFSFITITYSRSLTDIVFLASHVNL